MYNHSSKFPFCRLFRHMTDEERIFITQEKLKFEELLKKLGWSMECLLEEVGQR